MRALAAALLLLAALLLVAAPTSAAPSKCVVVVDQPDNGLTYCYTTTDPNCLVYETRTTFLGTETRCFIARPL